FWLQDRSTCSSRVCIRGPCGSKSSRCCRFRALRHKENCYPLPYYIWRTKNRIGDMDLEFRTASSLTGVVFANKVQNRFYPVAYRPAGCVATAGDTKAHRGL